MKSLRIFSFVALFVIFACQNQEDRQGAQDQTSNTPDASELLQRWDAAWNQNNLDSLQNLLADDAVLLLQGEELSPDELQQWMSQNSAVMKDLETNGSYNNSTNEVIYQAGTYSHGLRENDTLQLNGTFTFIWEQEQKDEWKLKVMSIAQRSQEADPDPQETTEM